MTNKVFTGTTSIEEHIKQLGIDGWIPHEERRAIDTTRTTGIHEQRDVVSDAPKQSIEIQRLKREAGLV